MSFVHEGEEMLSRYREGGRIGGSKGMVGWRRTASGISLGGEHVAAPDGPGGDGGDDAGEGEEGVL